MLQPTQYTTIATINWNQALELAAQEPHTYPLIVHLSNEISSGLRVSRLMMVICTIGTVFSICVSVFLAKGGTSLSLQIGTGVALGIVAAIFGGFAIASRNEALARRTHILNDNKKPGHPYLARLLIQMERRAMLQGNECFRQSSEISKTLLQQTVRS